MTIFLPRDVMKIASASFDMRATEWTESMARGEISLQEWEDLFDIAEANMSRLDWVVAMATEDLLSPYIPVESLDKRMSFSILKRDFGWDWSCELTPETYWPFGLSYKTEKILNHV